MRFELEWNEGCMCIFFTIPCSTLAKYLIMVIKIKIIPLKKVWRQRDTQCTSNAHKPFPAFPCLLYSPNLSTLALELLFQCMESTSEPLTRAALNQKSVAGRGVSHHEGHRHQRDAIFIHPEHTSVTSRRILPVSDWDRLHAIIKTAWIKT